MRESRTLFRVDNHPWSGRIAIRFAIRNQFNGKTAVATNIVFTDMDEGAAPPMDAPLVIDPDDAQMLFNELWREGFRPPNHKEPSTDGEVSALRTHAGDVSNAMHKLIDYLVREKP